MTLAELKAKAAELGLTPDDVRAYGSLAKKATWEAAIASKENEITIAQSQTSEATVEQSSDETVEQSQRVQEFGTAAIIPFKPTLTQLSKPDNSGYLIWSDKFKNWVKEKPENSTTPIRDKLLAKMRGYIDKGISLSDLEEMQLSSPDEKTAAIYLAILEESEALLREAVAA